MTHLRDGVFSISHSHWILHYHYTFFNQALSSAFGLDRFFSSPKSIGRSGNILFWSYFKRYCWLVQTRMPCYRGKTYCCRYISNPHDEEIF